MFITENQNVSDSVLYMLAARTALSNIIESSSVSDKDVLVDFIHNEASDYEIMGLLLNGKLPEEKYNVREEMNLFSNLKIEMMLNKDVYTEAVGENIFYSILNNVDSLTTLEGVSASKIAANYCLYEMLFEKASKTWLSKGVEWVKKKAGETKSGMEKAHQSAKAAQAKQAAAKAGSKAGGIKGKIAAKAADMKAARNTMDVTKDLYKKKQAAAANMKAAKKMAVKDPGALARAAKQTAGGGHAATGASLQQVAGAAAIAAAAIYAGYKIYKRFFSQAAKACSGKSGAEKTVCMNNYKKQAIQKQISATQSAAAKCSKSKDPAKCKSAIAKKIASLKSKAQKI